MDDVKNVRLRARQRVLKMRTELVKIERELREVGDINGADRTHDVVTACTNAVSALNDGPTQVIACTRGGVN